MSWYDDQVEAFATAHGYRGDTATKLLERVTRAHTLAHALTGTGEVIGCECAPAVLKAILSEREQFRPA